MQRGHILVSLILVALLSSWATGQSAAELRQKLEQLDAYPDLVAFNGQISTMDAQLREVEAMAVRDSRIIVLGSNEEIQSLAGPQTQRLDLKGRRVLPGLIDGHTHPHLWAVEHWLGAEGEQTARRYNDPQLRIVYAQGDTRFQLLAAVERVIKERAQELGPGKWIWVVMFAKDNIPDARDITWPLIGNPITTEFLDRLAPENPTMVFGASALGPSVNNSLAKAQMLQLLGREVNMLEARTSVTYQILFRDRLEDAADFVKREIETCILPQGITTFGNHYYNSPAIMKITNHLYQQGELPVRWAWWWGGTLMEDESTAYPHLGDFRGIGNDYIFNVGVSNEGWEDATPGGFSCINLKPLPGRTPSVGGLTLTTVPCAEEIDYEKSLGYRQVRAALESGLRIGFLHGYSVGTYDGFFRLVEQLIAEGKMTLEQVRSLRISFEHNPLIRPDQIEKFARYNLTPAFNGYQVQSRIKGGAFLKTYGEQYMKWMAPTKSLVDAGVHIVFNTDAHLYKVPARSKDMDYPEQWEGTIWGFMQFFLTRQMPDTRIYYNEEEALDRVTLMKAATIWGAEQLLREDHIGSLEKGKLADFISLDKDYFSIPVEEVGTIKTLMTVVGGKVVYRSSDY